MDNIKLEVFDAYNDAIYRLSEALNTCINLLAQHEDVDIETLRAIKESAYHDATIV